MARAVADSPADGQLTRVSAPAALAAAGVCVMGALLSLPVPFIGVPLAAAASAWLWFRDRRALAVVVVVLAAGATAVLDVAGPLYVLVWVAVSGPLAAWLLGRRTFMGTMLIVTLLTAATWGGLLAGMAAIEQKSVPTFMADLAKEQMRPGLVRAQGTDAASALEEQVEQVQRLFARLWPAVVTLLSGATALIATAAVAAVGRRAGAAVATMPRLAELDVSPRSVVVLIVALVAIAIDKFTGGVGGGVLGIAGENLLHVVRWVFFAQGMAVFAGLYEKAGLRRFARTFGFTVLALTEMLLPLVSLTGLVDVWLNIRKLPREHGGGSE